MGDIRVGVDLGRKQDYTAIVAAELVNTENDEFNIPMFERLQLGTPFGQVIDRVLQVRDGIKRIQDQRDLDAGMQTEDLNNYGPDEILVDQSGLGDPVVEEMRRRDLFVTGVLLTGGNQVFQENLTLHIAKTALVSRLQVLFGDHRIHFAKGGPLAEKMIEELENFRLKVTPAANLQFEPFKTGIHDDLIVALGLACFRRYRPFGIEWV